MHVNCKGVPKPFWAEDVKWTFYVLNRSPTMVVKNMTPQEAWSGIKPSVVHFIIWGCIGHVHIPINKRSKLDNKSFPCVFLGVSDESKGYRLYDPSTKNIMTSKDVIFEEDKRWDWDSGFKEQIDAELTWGDDISDDESDENIITPRVDAEVEIVQEEKNTAERPRRSRRSSTWLRDYESGEGLSDPEEAAYLTYMDIEDPNNFICFKDLALMATQDNDDPLCFDDVVQEEKWRQAMDKEIISIEKNNTWSLTHLPKEAKKIGVKWLYKTKHNEHGKGYSQREVANYTEVYAAVARLDTVCSIIALATTRKWSIYQLHVKSAFLHGTLNEDVYIEQPKGYEQKGKEQMVYKLHKALYGLK